jgi:hypothetical protein
MINIQFKLINNFKSGDQQPSFNQRKQTKKTSSKTNKSEYSISCSAKHSRLLVTAGFCHAEY